MSSAQLREHEPPAALPKPTQQTPMTLPDRPKGSPVTKWIVIVVILAAVGGAIWKIRANSLEQATTNTRALGQGDRATPVMVTKVEQKTMPNYLTALGTGTADKPGPTKTSAARKLIEVPVP